MSFVWLVLGGLAVWLRGHQSVTVEIAADV